MVKNSMLQIVDDFRKNGFSDIGIELYEKSKYSKKIIKEMAMDELNRSIFIITTQHRLLIDMERISDLDISKISKNTTIYIGSKNHPIVLPTNEIRKELRTILKYFKKTGRYDMLLKLQ